MIKTAFNSTSYGPFFATGWPTVVWRLSPSRFLTTQGERDVGDAVCPHRVVRFWGVSSSRRPNSTELRVGSL